MIRKSLLALGFAGFCGTAGAVVTISGNVNNTAPVGQPYFGNVGSVNGATAIYLGDGWVLTASHVAGSVPGSAVFGGTSYGTEPGSFHQLTNPVQMPTLTPFADIVLFQLATSPALPDLAISAVTPTVGSQVMMIGDGRTQAAALTYWDHTVVAGENNDVWVETVPPLSNVSGYQTNDAQELRWGKNAVAGNGLTLNSGYGDVLSYYSTYDTAGLTEEGQAVAGDSGGASFSLVGGVWQLSGMIHAVGTLDSQPGGSSSAIIGDATAMADLSKYRGQILAIVPEPAAAMLGLVGACLLLRRRR
jgi:hypothetical protein